MLKGLILFFIVAYLSVANATDDTFQLEITPAWNGIYKADQATEIKLRLYSSQPGGVRLEAGQISREVELKANTPTDFSLPYKPDQLSPALLTTSSKNIANASVEKRLTLTVSQAFTIAIVSEGLTIEQRQKLKILLSEKPKDKLLFISQKSLPEFNTGYQVIDLLVIHFDAIKQMHEQQSKALRHFVSQCGKVVVIKFPLKLQKQLHRMSACGESNILSIASFDNISSSLPKRIKLKSIELPGKKELSTLVGNKKIDSPYVGVLVFCLAYLLVLLMTLLISKNKLTLFIVPVIATLSTFVVWFSHSPSFKLTSLQIVETGHSIARYSALLDIQGLGKWKQNLVLPTDALFANQSSELKYQLSSINSHEVAAKLNLALFSKQQWFWQSDITIVTPLMIEIKQGQLSVSNISNEATKSGFVIWKKKQYLLPALEAGYSWQSDLQVLEDDESISSILLQKYAQYYTAAVLIPFFAEIVSFDTQQTGWLLIHSKRIM